VSVESIEELEHQLGDASGTQRISLLLDLAYQLHMRNLPRMRNLIDDALALSLEIGDRAGESRSYNLLSIYWGVLGDYAKALNAALRSVEILREIGDTDQLSARYNNISLIHKRMGDLESHRKYTHLTLETAEVTGDDRVMSSALNNLGNLQEDEGDFEGALENQRLAAALREELGEWELLALSLVNIGQLLVRMERLDEAGNVLNRALSIALEEEVPFLTAAARSTLGELEIARGNHDGARSQIEEALIIAEKLKDCDLLLKTLQNCVVLEEGAGRYDRALTRYRELSALVEQVQTEERNRYVARLQAEFDMRDKEREAEIYRLKNVELQKAMEVAEAADRAKSDFLAMMSHEIRTPMNIILGMTELTLDSGLDSVQKSYVSRTAIATRSLLGLINDILDFSRIEAGRMEYESIEFSPEAVLNETATLFEVGFADRGLSLSVEHDPDIPPILRGDPFRLGQVLRNLLGNAMKFTEDGGAVLMSSLHESTEEMAKVEFRVSNTGPEIRSEIFDQLFEPFTQDHTSPIHPRGGTGLGLTICRRLVEGMGGRIWVESNTEIGSTFHFLIPFTVPEPSTQRETSDTFEPLDMTGTRVLLAEDVEPIRDIVRIFLGKLGVSCVPVSDGEAALEALKGAEFDLILMDVQMPRMDGLSAAAEARRRGVKIPIIAMTAHVMSDHIEMCHEAGMDDILNKPFSMSELRAILGRWLSAGRNPSS
jgi:signal transduction histidine kinase